VILQVLNRLQNTNDVLLANSESGETRRMFRDQNDSWVEVNNQMRWLDGRRKLSTA
jgi:dipeptidyl peptidase IV (DPP IV)-like protein